MMSRTLVLSSSASAHKQIPVDHILSDISPCTKEDTYIFIQRCQDKREQGRIRDVLPILDSQAGLPHVIPRSIPERIPRLRLHLLLARASNGTQKLSGGCDLQRSWLGVVVRWSLRREDARLRNKTKCGFVYDITREFRCRAA